MAGTVKIPNEQSCEFISGREFRHELVYFNQAILAMVVLSLDG